MIELKNVKYCVDSENELSFSIATKGIHGIFCSDEAERIMLTDILSGARDAAFGSVLVGKETADIPVSEYKAKIGCALFDAPFYSDATVEETLDFVGRAKCVEPDKRYRQIKEALSFLSIEKISKKQIAKLSAQNKARVSIAQSLLGNPDILIFEEPIALFDSNTAEICELLGMLGKMKNVIIISTNQELLKAVCEDVIVVENGSISFSGSVIDMPIYTEEAVVEINETEENE